MDKQKYCRTCDNFDRCLGLRVIGICKLTEKEKIRMDSCDKHTETKNQEKEVKKINE